MRTLASIMARLRRARSLARPWYGRIPLATIRISLDGQPIDAAPGDTLAAALLRNGVTTFTRSIKYHRPRGPFCLGGSCGQCLMRVDGVPSIQACRTRA